MDHLMFAITGGIGSGKSYVCRMLEKQLGIKIYDCDEGAKRLMATSTELQENLCRLIGSDAFVDGRLNKPVVAQFLLQSESNKQAINAIVHPAVIADFYQSGMQWMESAILYEAHLEDKVDFVVCVTAPEEIRLERIMKRDGISREKAQEWIDRQMPQEETARRADFVIVNDGAKDIEKQLEQLKEKIEKQSE